MQKLNPQEVATQLLVLPHWTLDESGGAITRQFVTKDFIQAFAFMTQIAISSEKHNHHPEWRNVYNQVSVTWTTHDVQGLSANDIAMATYCDQVFDLYRPDPPTALPGRYGNVLRSGI
jgi:4a-hydroxytetrahydrobiopterin dehydratase